MKEALTAEDAEDAEAGRKKKARSLPSCPRGSIEVCDGRAKLKDKAEEKTL
jgi:hypothetical protein